MNPRRPGPPELQRIVPSGEGPLYRLAKRQLQRLVEHGRYAPGDTLPSESVIAGAMGVSIGTLRRAVDELVHENLLVRRQGRGTFVALHNADRFIFQFFRVEARPLSPGDPPQPRELPQVECLAFGRARADDTEAAALRIRPGEAVIRIDNRLSLRGRPVVLDRIAIPAAAFKGLTEKRFRDRPGTVYSLYQTDFGLTVLRADERVRAGTAKGEVSRLLGVAPGQAVLEVHRIARTFGDEPVEIRVSTIHTAAHDYVSSRGEP